MARVLSAEGLGESSMSRVFEGICEVVREESGLTTPQARGIVRLVLKEAGLSHETLRRREARVAVERLLATRLKKNGLGEDAAELVVHTALQRIGSEPEPEASGADAMFDRLDDYFGL